MNTIFSIVLFIIWLGLIILLFICGIFKVKDAILFFRSPIFKDDIFNGIISILLALIFVAASIGLALYPFS